MGGGVLEARDLLVLRRQVPDRVEDEVGERERAVDARGREVADRDLDLAPAPGFARSRATIASDRSMPATRTPRAESGSAIRPVPIAELERRAVARELGEEVDDRVDDGRVEHRRVVVVAGGDRLAEVVLGHPARSRSTRTAETLYSGVPISGSPTS